MIEFSNPRLKAEFDNWPSGGQIVQCKFEVEEKKKQYRVLKSTTRNGVWCKPKMSTYGSRVAIMDGSDGKTYIVWKSQYSAMVQVSAHDFMNIPDELLGIRSGCVYASDNPDLYGQLSAMVDSLYVESTATVKKQ